MGRGNDSGKGSLDGVLAREGAGAGIDASAKGRDDRRGVGAPGTTEPLIQKVSYFTKVGDQVCAGGYYK